MFENMNPQQLQAILGLLGGMGQAGQQSQGGLVDIGAGYKMYSRPHWSTNLGNVLGGGAMGYSQGLMGGVLQKKLEDLKVQRQVEGEDRDWTRRKDELGIMAGNQRNLAELQNEMGLEGLPLEKGYGSREEYLAGEEKMRGIKADEQGRKNENTLSLIEKRGADIQKAIDDLDQRERKFGFDQQKHAERLQLDQKKLENEQEKAAIAREKMEAGLKPTERDIRALALGEVRHSRNPDGTMMDPKLDMEWRTAYEQKVKELTEKYRMPPQPEPLFPPAATGTATPAPSPSVPKQTWLQRQMGIE